MGMDILKAPVVLMPQCCAA